ncbi:MAG: PorT family protein [Bacteroidales bacterium]|nr:PorT family protein [Bacteroidales bacterium]
MKKSILIVLAIALSLTAFSQIELKPAIGFNVARFDSNPVVTIASVTDSLVSTSKAGYQIGASLAVGRQLYIEPGLFYTKLTQNFTPSDPENPEFVYSANYLRVPVNFGFQFIGHTTSFAGLRIFLGPSMLIPLSVKENEFGLVKDDLKSPQFDFSVGAGLNIWFLFLDVSYGWGLTPQYKVDPIEAKMQAFYANLGFRFKLKSEE